MAGEQGLAEAGHESGSALGAGRGEPGQGSGREQARHVVERVAETDPVEVDEPEVVAVRDDLVEREVAVQQGSRPGTKGAPRDLGHVVGEVDVRAEHRREGVDTGAVHGPLRGDVGTSGGVQLAEAGSQAPYGRDGDVGVKGATGQVLEGDEARHAATVKRTRPGETIIVSDAVNLVAAVVLYFLAVGGVQGFAFTLGVTTVVDLIVIMAFTHPMMAWILRFPFFGQGHRLSGLDPEHLGARNRSAYGKGHEAAVAAVGESLARRKARARQETEPAAHGAQAVTAQKADDAVDPQATSRKEGQE